MSTSFCSALREIQAFCTKLSRLEMTPELLLIAIIVVAVSVYLLNKEKAALYIAICGALYLLPFLISGHLF